MNQEPTNLTQDTSLDRTKSKIVLADPSDTKMESVKVKEERERERDAMREEKVWTGMDGIYEVRVPISTIPKGR